MYGTWAPTARNFEATAIASRPVAASRAMMDHVIDGSLSGHLAAGSVALHAARIGGGAAAPAGTGGRGEPTFRPVGTDLDDVAASAQLIERRLRKPSFH